MTGYQIERCVVKTKPKRLPEQIIEKESLYLCVFDKIEVTTIAIDEATIALPFQLSLIARSLLRFSETCEL